MRLKADLLLFMVAIIWAQPLSRKALRVNMALPIYITV